MCHQLWPSSKHVIAHVWSVKTSTPKYWYMYISHVGGHTHTYTHTHTHTHTHTEGDKNTRSTVWPSLNYAMMSIKLSLYIVHILHVYMYMYDVGWEGNPPGSSLARTHCLWEFQWSVIKYNHTICTVLCVLLQTVTALQQATKCTCMLLLLHHADHRVVGSQSFGHLMSFPRNFLVE